MRSVVSDRFPNFPLPPPVRPKPLGPQRPLHETPPPPLPPGQPTPAVACASSAPTVSAATSAAKTHLPPPATPPDALPAEGLDAAPRSNCAAGGSADVSAGGASAAGAAPTPPLTVCLHSRGLKRPVPLLCDCAVEYAVTLRMWDAWVPVESGHSFPFRADAHCSNPIKISSCTQAQLAKTSQN